MAETPRPAELSSALAPVVADGEKSQVHDILTAIRTLQRIEREHRTATNDERDILARFGGFGAVALSLFLNAVTGRYKEAGWQTLNDELKSLLSVHRIRLRQTDDVQSLWPVTLLMLPTSIRHRAVSPPKSR